MYEKLHFYYFILNTMILVTCKVLSLLSPMSVVGTWSKALFVTGSSDQMANVELQ